MFKTLSSIYNEYLLNQDERQKVYQKMREEIDESERKIRLSYQEKIDLSENNCTALRQELERVQKLLEKYSTFDSKLIGSIIEKLVTLFEGEEYSYQEANYETYERKTTVFGSETFEVNKKILMIVKGGQKKEYYRDYDERDDQVNKLVQDGQAFILAKDEYGFSKNITFYSANEGKGKSLIDFNKFSYVKDFIDLVVEYRFKHNLDTISEKELLSLMSEFILSKQELIKDNFNRRALERQELLNKQLIEEQLKYYEELARHNEEAERVVLENLLQNGLPSRHNNHLIDRLREEESNNDDFNNAMNQLEISYEGDKNIARITYEEPIVSTENIFISKINIASSIKDFYDDSDPDPHFHGFCDIDLVDDGLIGIVDISNLKQDLDSITNALGQDGLLYKVDKISDKYLRVLYLLNNGIYGHRPMNIYNWVIGRADNHQDEKNTSYKVDWDSSLETEKMLTYLKEIELLSNLDEKQLKLYKQSKK